MFANQSTHSWRQRGIQISCAGGTSDYALRVNKNKLGATVRALCAKDHDDVNYSLVAPNGTLSDRGLLFSPGAAVHARNARS